MRKPSPTLVIAIIALFVALGGAGMAATGGTFILGRTNSAGATSYLSAPVARGSALNVSNLSTTAGSSALRLNAASGHAPFSVNSSTKVSGLNADMLDGIDSTGFVQGRGTFLANRIVDLPGTYAKTLVTIPGLGHLYADCYSNDAHVEWFNDTGGNVGVWHDLSNSHFDGTVAAPNASVDVASTYLHADGGTLSLGVGNDPNARRTALLHAFAYQSAQGAPCGFEVQGTLWTSP